MNRFLVRKLWRGASHATCHRLPRQTWDDVSMLHSPSRELATATWFEGNYSKRLPPLNYPMAGLRQPLCISDQAGQCPTKVTTLANGLKIASEDSMGPAACVGLFINSGSMYESVGFTGISHLLERMAFSSTKNRSRSCIVREIEGIGANAGASASREQMVYSCDTLKAYIPEAVELLIDCVRNPSFLDDEIREQLDRVKYDSAEATKDPQRFLLESLHPVCYSGALGNPLLAPEEVLDTITGSSIAKFYHDNYTADRMVLAAFGVEHEYLLSIAEPLLNDLHRGKKVEVPKSVYVGGDFRCKLESEKTNVALAFEVPGGWHQEKEATTLSVLQTLMGGGSSFSAGGPGKGMHSRLYLRVLNQYREMDSISAFSSMYDDTGLFGIHLATGADFLEEAVGVAIDELQSIATPGQVTDLELSRAKNSMKSAVFTNLESRSVAVEDIGRQILTYGSRKPVEHFIELLDELTLDDLTSLARRILSSPLTMASLGDVDHVPDYESTSRRFELPQ